MSSILTGRLNLSKIPADLIQEDRNGNQVVWIDVAERREPSQYGDTHYISIYDKTTRQKVYIGELRPRELGSDAPDPSRPSAFPPRAAAPAPTPRPAPVSPAPAPDPDSLDPQAGDLPF